MISRLPPPVTEAAHLMASLVSTPLIRVIAMAEGVRMASSDVPKTAAHGCIST